MKGRKIMLSLFRKLFPKITAKSVKACKDKDKIIVISKNLDENINCIKNYLSNSMDIRDRRFKAGGSDTNIAVVFIDNLVNEMMVQDHIIKPVMTNSLSSHNESSEVSLQTIKDFLVFGDIVKEVSTIDEISLGILSGETFLYVEGSDKGLLINTVDLPARSIDEPVVEPSVKGPKEGFIENLRDNVALIRKRLKDPNLCFEPYKIGKHTRNNAVIVYIKGIASQELVEEVRRRVTSSDTYDLVDAEQLAHLISDRPSSLFPLVQWTERPDKVVSAILAGRVGIIVDNSHGTLLVPVTFPSLLQSVDDYYEKWLVGSIIRLMRYTALFVSTLLPAIYIAVTSFHPGMLPTALTLSIAGSRAGVPFPAFLEALLMVVTLELLQEAGIRLPRVVGQTVAIVGGLVIGQSAVQAGITSPIMVIIVSLTAIASFAIPSYSLSLVTRVLRIVFMILAASLGAYGIAMGVLYMLGYMCSLKSFGIGYMDPITPYRFKDWRDTFIRVPQYLLKSRPEYLTSGSNQNQSGKGGTKGGK